MDSKNIVSLSDLFSKKVFRIPDYQRGYSWQNQQLSEFWTDLLNTTQSGEKHYTGMLSLKQLTKEEAKNWRNIGWLLESLDYNPNHIVDGQQRLTTIEILIKVIINYCKKMNYETLNGTSIETIQETYLQQYVPESDNRQISYLFGYDVDKESDDYFKYHIMEAPNSPSLTESIYTENMNHAKQFFEKKLLELLDLEENKASQSKERLDALFETITNRLMFNIYNVEADFNVFLAFETMNNRGKKLSNLELLKNRLIYLSTLFNVSDSLKEDIRKTIDETWKEVYQQLGKNKNFVLLDDDYLQAHWIIYFGYNRKQSAAYSSFLLNEYFVQQNIEGLTTYVTDNTKREKITVGDLLKYVDSLKSLASKWYFINNPDDIILDSDDGQKKKIKYYLNRLKRLGAGYFKPLMTVIYNDDKISDEEKIKVFYLIERYQFFHFRVYGYKSSNQNSVFYNLAHTLYNGTKSVNDCIRELETIDYMEDGVISSNIVAIFSERLFKKDGFYSWETKNYLLYEYENKLKEGKEITKIIPEDYFKSESKKVTIEHIYPQTPTDQTWIENFKDYNDEQKRIFQGSLGNLLPLAQKINSQLQNYSFDVKKNGVKNSEGIVEKRGYKEGSYNEMEVATENVWGPEQILKRGLSILSFMEEHWDFKFKDMTDKKKFLGLDFMTETEDD